MKNVIHAYGVLASPLQVSQTLTQLGISHIVIDGSLRALPKVKDVAKAQPAWPVVLPSLQAFRRFKLATPRQVVYVCDSQAALTATNLRILRPTNWVQTMQKSLQHAVVHMFMPDWHLVETEKTIQEHVDTASNPSFLHGILSEVYKLTPYDLRKSVNELIIAYLVGIESKSRLKLKLDSSHKLDKIKDLMSDPTCAQLKQAVAEYQRTGQSEEAALAHGVQSFDIMYLVKSSAKKKSI